MTGLKVFKFKPQPLLKNCKFVREKTIKAGGKNEVGKITQWVYAPRFEKSLFESDWCEVVEFLDKNEKKVVVDFEELKKYNYVHEQRPEICKCNICKNNPKTAEEGIEIIRKSIEGKEPKPKKKVSRQKAKEKIKEITGVEIEDPKMSKINIMLSYEKKPFKSMAIGEHKGNYYFGSILDYGRKKVPVLITDDKQVYWMWKEKVEKETIIDNEIRDKFGLNYRFELFEDCVDNLWSNKSIKKFINGEYDELKFKEIYESIRDKNKELMFHSDKRVHSFIACDIISNYFYPLFNAKGRTYFQADFGSGKSRQSLIYQKLSFNSLFASNISAASFERVVESTGGTLIVDNFDNCQDDLKKAILQCIEVYYKKGGKNIKAAGQGLKKNDPIAFNGYSPLVINNIVGLPEVTESRCNKIAMLKTEKKNIVDIRINEKDSYWEDTKDNLHILALQNWKKIKEVYDNLEVSELTARDLERAEAVLTIAKFIGEDVYKEILDLIIEINEQQSIREIGDSWEFILFECLNNLMKDKEVEKYSVREISHICKDKIIKEERTAKTDKIKFSHYSGKVLSSSGFKKIIINGWVHYEIKKEKLLDMIKIKKYDKYLTLPHPTSPNNTNNTNITYNKVGLSEVGEVGMVKNTPIKEKKQ